jgi:hypothetical protein
MLRGRPNFANEHFYESAASQDPGVGTAFRVLQLMQATGLTDKHGQEIYEGDILRAKDGLYVVRWKENYAGFRAFHTASGEAHHMKRRYEVIGNIWENPERGKEASA